MGTEEREEGRKASKQVSLPACAFLSCMGEVPAQGKDEEGARAGAGESGPDQTLEVSPEPQSHCGCGVWVQEDGGGGPASSV